MTTPARTRFDSAIATVTGEIGERSLDQDLDSFLNQRFGPGSAVFESLADACRTGIAEGWLCNREHGGIKFGRVIKPGGPAGRFSVDVVEMDDIKGPHHRHPEGEIDMIMAVDDEARFDGRETGWLVYGPDSAHHPTVTGGKAIVLYLLPQGAIEFTGQ